MAKYLDYAGLQRYDGIVERKIEKAIEDILPEATASGNPISIDNASGFNAKSAKVTMLPIQDLHGQDAPYPAGGGKNKFQTTATSDTKGGVVYTVNSDGTIGVSGNATSSTSYSVGEALVSSSMGNVAISGIETATNIAWNSIQLFDANDTVLYAISGGSTASYFSVDLSQYTDAYKIKITVKRNNNGAVSGTIKPQVEIGTTPTAFEPYSNICPISGRDSVVFSQFGKNKIEYETDSESITSNGVTITRTGSYFQLSGTASAYTTFTFSLKNTVNLAPLLNKIAFNNDFTNANVTVYFMRYTTELHYWTMNSANRVATDWTDSGNENVNNVKITVSNGTTVSGYNLCPILCDKNETEYKTTHTATFPSTVYGGEYEFVAGDLIDKYNKITISSSATVNTFTADSTYGSWARLDIQPRGKVSIDNIMAICSMAKGVSYNNRAAEPTKDRVYVDENGYIVLRANNTQTITTQAELLAYFDGADVCYELKTPTETTLTPQTIALNKGNNVITTDGDNAELKYSVSLDSLINSSNSTRALNLTKGAEPIEETTEEPKEENKEEK